jgi:proline iminopeptidase
MQPLYPEIKPNETNYLTTDDHHRLYYEESGTVSGLPVLVLHGGPGAPSNCLERRYFDPEKYRIILLDQRGCGKSTPHGNIDNNTTQLLINDIEMIRKKLKIKKWLVLGGGWGTTLTLAYAEKYPQQIAGLILRSVFLGRQKDIDWLYKDGTSRIYPDFWQKFIKPIPINEQDDIVKAFHKRLTGKNELAKMGAAKAWAFWEASVSTFECSSRFIEYFTKPHFALGVARISAHYFINGCFLKENQLLNNAHQLKGIPGIIVHGRYDMLSPLENAYSLQKVWPDVKIHTIREAGHAALERCIADGLVKATNEMYDIIEPEICFLHD